MSEAERVASWVANSAALAGFPVTPGHPVALEEALRLGRAGERVPVESLDGWRLGLEAEAELESLDELAGWLVERFSAQLGRPWPARGQDPSLTVEALAETVERAAPLDPRLAHLLLAWATELLARPFFAVGPQDAEALADPARLRLLLAGKLRVAAYDLQQRRLEWVGGDAGAGRYAAPDGSSQLIVEWHELQAAEARWRSDT